MPQGLFGHVGGGGVDNGLDGSTGENDIGVKGGLYGVSHTGGGHSGAGGGLDIGGVGHADKLGLVGRTVRDHLGADALSFSLDQDLTAGDGAVGVYTEHSLDHAAEALGLGGDDIARAIAGGIHRNDLGGEPLNIGHRRKVRAVGKDYLFGGLRGLGLLFSDDGGGDLVGDRQSSGDDGTDEDQHDNRGDQGPGTVFLFHAASPPPKAL